METRWCWNGRPYGRGGNRASVIAGLLAGAGKNSQIQGAIRHSAAFDRVPPESAKAFDYIEQNAGDHYKNIRIVKELPETEITPLMATFQSGLGVKCEYCHNQSAYDDDKLETKVVARRMLAMVRDLNAREFAGRQAVTCFTCHRGKSTPDR